MKNLKLILLLIIICQISFAQERSVFGVVKDTSGVLLPGVNIGVKGTTIGAQTDVDGQYWIKTTANDTLVFSFIETKTKNIRADKNDINAILEYIDYSNDCIYYEDSNPAGTTRGVRPAISVYTKEDYKKLSKKDLRIYKRTIKSSKRDLNNNDNPKYNFKKVKDRGYVIYKKDNCYFNKDQDFQQKYNVAYSLLPYHLSKEYAEEYNKLVFKYLNKKYKRVWQSEIRKDVFGLNEFLN